MERNARKGSLVMEPAERWTAQHASELYDVASWGKGYFSVDGSGHLRVHPDKDPQRSIDLKQLVDTLVLRGISLPVLNVGCWALREIDFLRSFWIAAKTRAPSF